MQVFGTFPRLFRAGVFTFWAARLFFSMQICRTPRTKRVFSGVPLGSTFRSARPQKAPKEIPRIPQKVPKIVAFFLGRRPVWKKWRTPRAKRVFRKNRSRGSKLASLHFSCIFLFFWSPDGFFWTPLGGPCGGLGDLFGSVGAKRVIFLRPGVLLENTRLARGVLHF